MNRQAQTSIPVEDNCDESLRRDTWIGPELVEWTRSNAVLARQFSIDLAGGNRSASVYLGFVVQIAGDYIWATSCSKPDWAQLDVDGFQREILQERLRLDDIATGNFNVSLAAFCTYLYRRERLAKETTARILRGLEKYDNPYVRKTFSLANKNRNTPGIASLYSFRLRRRMVAYTSTKTSPSPGSTMTL